MRLGVLDVGSNSAHLEVVDLRAGEAIRRVKTVKHPTLLAGAIASDGHIRAGAVDRLVGAIGATARAANAENRDELVAYPTSSVRDAANRDAIIARVAAETGVRLGYLCGRDEARLTFLAAREWY